VQGKLKENYGSGQIGNYRGEIRCTFMKSISRSTVVLVFPLLLIVGALVYTRFLETPVSIVCLFVVFIFNNIDLIGSLSLLFLTLVICFVSDVLF
jgi:hypothetical protein